MKRIKLQKARDKARQDVEREEKAESRAQFSEKKKQILASVKLIAMFGVLIFFYFVPVALLVM